MPTVRVTSEDGTFFPAGSEVTLHASVDSGSPTAWEWRHQDKSIPGENNQEYRFVMSEEKAGHYVAVATLDGKQVESRPYRVSLEQGQQEPPPEFDIQFAVVTGVLAIAGAWLALRYLLTERAGFTETEWAALEGRLKIAAILPRPLIVLGTLTVIVGLWMAVVEWRGRFARVKRERVFRWMAVKEPHKIIEALGKLRGAALAMVIGTILLLGAAWVAQSAAAPPQPSPTPGTTPASTPNESAPNTTDAGGE